MNKTRRHFSGTEKVAILKRHLVDKVPVSDLCDQLQLHPNQIYGWLKEFFENGQAAFDNGRKSKADENAKDQKIQQLEANNVTKKGTGFVQPLKTHQEWHVDVSYLNIAGTFYYLCSLLDGYSRSIVHWEIREAMKESDVTTIIQHAREIFPDARPRIISDNGPQFIAKDFKEFIRIMGMTHARTSPYYPQSDGKLERFHKTIKGECIRPNVPLSLDDARRLVTDYVQHYNHVRLHSAIGYVTPNDRLLGKDEAIHAERDCKLAEARELRKKARQSRHEQNEAQLDASRPGVYSARYAGKQGDDAANNTKLLNELAKLPADQRDAYYVCTAALADPTGKIHAVVEARCHGRIVPDYRGEGGFGYDPLFLIPEYHQTFGQLSATVKHALSHRGRALMQLRPVLRALVG